MGACRPGGQGPTHPHRRHPHLGQAGINAWMTAAGIEDGRLLRSVSKSGEVNRDTLSDWAVWSVVEQSSKQIGIERFGTHDLRRTCAKLCRKNGGDLRDSLSAMPSACRMSNRAGRWQLRSANSEQSRRHPGIRYFYLLCCQPRRNPRPRWSSLCRWSLPRHTGCNRSRHHIQYPQFHRGWWQAQSPHRRSA
jgi:hypothetical protein